MRVVGWMALGLVLLAGSALADEIYRSTDAAGRPVFSNGRGGSGDARQDVAPAAAPATEDAENFSTGASLRRQALERDLRTSERRLRDLDARLAGKKSKFPLPMRKFRELKMTWEEAPIHLDDELWPGKKDKPKKSAKIKITVKPSALVIRRPHAGAKR